MSASREKHEEAVSYLGEATSLGECGRGSSTGGRSLWAKKPSRETSIRWILGFPAFIAWLASWNAFDKGSKSNTKWIARSYPSSLTKILDQSTLLRAATLTKLSRGATCALPAKTSEEQNMVKLTKSTIEVKQGVRKERW